MSKLKEWTLQQKIWRIFLSVLVLIFGCIYIGLLIVPNWELFIKYPILHQLIAYLTLFGIIALIFFILYIIIDLAFSNQRLSDKNKDLDSTINKLEKEIIALQSR